MVYVENKVEKIFLYYMREDKKFCKHQIFIKITYMTSNNLLIKSSWLDVIFIFIHSYMTSNNLSIEKFLVGCFISFI